MTARKTDLRVDVATLKSTHHGDPVKIRLRVEDATSGELLVELDFDANTWWDLLTGMHMRLEGLVGGNLDRVGRQMVVRQVKVPRDVHEGLYGDKAEAPVRAWAKDQRVDGETMETRLTNSGWLAIYRSWPEVS